jgi:hypothetical protein
LSLAFNTLPIFQFFIALLVLRGLLHAK